MLTLSRATQLTVTTLAFSCTAQLPAQSRPTNPAGDSAAIVAAAERFHGSMARGDSASVAQLLAPDLAVLESGGVENRAEYLAHHLGADIAFAKAVPSQRTVVSVAQQGDVAWVVATSVTKGEYRGRQLDSRGAELMVLSRSGSGWLIRSIHWSSRRAAP